jgi:pilus assembly protein CpaF
VVTIEDSAELQLWGVKNLIRLETRNANLEGGKVITIRDLIKASLRVRPDRIIVGEVRGAEALDMIGSAMNCGHDGSMSTAHANSAQDMLVRLETMILMAVELPVGAIRRQIASGVDIIVHLGRLRDKSRKVLEITELAGMEGDRILCNPIFCFQETGSRKADRVEGELKRVGRLQNVYKMESAGITGFGTQAAR